MREVPRDEKWVNDPVEVEENTGAVSPSAEERELTIITLLMRLYDVNMALLNHFNPDEADRVYDAHEAGENFNPTIFIPTFDKE